MNRWKDHHRLEQLKRINRRNKIKIAWLSCNNNLKLLADTENYFINFYQPLLNRTSVPAKEITPAEITLQQSLSNLLNIDVVILGWETAIDSFPATIYLKYFVDSYKPMVANTIIKAINQKKATGLKWKKSDSSRFRSWTTGCNGVNIDLSPWKFTENHYFNFNFLSKVKENTILQTVAGVKIPTLTESELANILNQYPFIREKYPRISALKHDPIPLLWSKQ